MGTMRRKEAREADARATVGVYMHYSRDATTWLVTFLDRASGNQIGTVRRFTSPDALPEMARRGGALKLQEDHHAMAHAIEKGRGSLLLELTREQYRKLAG